MSLIINVTALLISVWFLILLFFHLESKKSTCQKNQEPTCPTSSPLPGAAPANTSVFCLETGLTTISKQFNKTQEYRCGVKRKERGRIPNKTASQSVMKEDIHQLKEGHTPSPERTVKRFVSLENPSALLKLGVGRRTAILFKKAKTVDLSKSKPLSLQNEVSVDQTCEKIHLSSLCTSSAQISFSSSSHHLRSQGLSAVQESETERVNTHYIKRHRDRPWNYKSASLTHHIVR